MQLAQYKKFFLSEARTKLKEIEDELLKFEKDTTNIAVIDTLMTLIHTLKSDASTMSYTHFATALHQTESLFLAIKDKKVSVTNADIDSLYMLIDQFRSNLEEIQSNDAEIDLGPATAFMIRAGTSSKEIKKSKSADSGESLYEPLASFVEVSTEDMEKVLDRVNNIISRNQHMQRTAKRGHAGQLTIALHNEASELSELRQVLVDLKMMPVKQYFVFLSRLVRDLARNGKKFITFTFEDHNLRFERAILESLREVCVQLIKNAIDHGFSEGESGKVTLSFGLKSQKLIMTITDNGSGIDWKKIEKRAIKNKKISKSALSKLSKSKREQRLFELGVSSRDEATMTSGRGVGWTSVRQSVHELNGSIELVSKSSKRARGTTVTITVPLTPTMFRSLTWKWGEFYLGLPLFVMDNVIQLPENTAKLQKTYTYKKKRIPLVDYSVITGIASDKQSMIPDAIVVLKHEGKLVGLPIPSGASEQELIVESLTCLQKFDRVSGVAVSELSIPITIVNHRMIFESVYGKR